MVKINAPVEDLCRVSGEVSAYLMSQSYRRPGNVHIFKDGLHAKLTLLDESQDFRITTKKRGDRDGVPIGGNLNNAIKQALDDSRTSALVFDSSEYNSNGENEQHGVINYLKTQGTLTTLDKKPILVIDDRYYNIFVI